MEMLAGLWAGAEHWNCRFQFGIEGIGMLIVILGG